MRDTGAGISGSVPGAGSPAKGDSDNSSIRRSRPARRGRVRREAAAERAAGTRTGGKDRRRSAGAPDDSRGVEQRLLIGARKVGLIDAARVVTTRGSEQAFGFPPGLERQLSAGSTDATHERKVFVAHLMFGHLYPRPASMGSGGSPGRMPSAAPLSGAAPPGHASRKAGGSKRAAYIPLIPRESKRWRSLYRGRAAVEREFGRLKNEWALLPLRVRGIERVRLHADLTILARGNKTVQGLREANARR